MNDETLPSIEDFIGNRGFQYPLTEHIVRYWGGSQNKITENIKDEVDAFLTVPHPLNSADVRRWAPIAKMLLNEAIHQNNRNEFMVEYFIGVLETVLGLGRTTTIRTLKLGFDTTSMRNPDGANLKRLQELRVQMRDLNLAKAVTRWLLLEPADFFNAVSMTIVPGSLYTKPVNLPN